jgi:hypothetical protein
MKLGKDLEGTGKDELEGTVLGDLLSEPNVRPFKRHHP